MKNTNLQKIYYRLRHQYLTTNNIVIAIGLFMAVSWAWGSVGVLQRNYTLQREIDAKKKQLTLAQLETDTLRYQQSYFKSDEYKEYAVRQRLGLVFPGEKVLILPPNTAAAQALDTSSSTQTTRPQLQPSNTEQWVDFLFGGSSRDLQQ